MREEDAKKLLKFGLICQELWELLEGMDLAQIDDDHLRRTLMDIKGSMYKIKHLEQWQGGR